MPRSPYNPSSNPPALKSTKRALARASASLAATGAVFAQTIADGDLTRLDEQTGVALADLEAARQACAAAVKKHGALIKNAVGVDRSGEAIFTTVANPALRDLRALSETLGQTAADTLISRKSRGTAAADLAAAALNRMRLRRLAEHSEKMLRDPNYAGPRLPPPPQRRPVAVEVTATSASPSPSEPPAVDPTA